MKESIEVECIFDNEKEKLDDVISEILISNFRFIENDDMDSK